MVYKGPTFEDAGSYEPDNLLAGTFPVKTRVIKIAPNQDLKRGALLGKGPSGYVLSLSKATDGSQRPVAILAVDVKSKAKEEQGIVYKTGDFNFNDMTIGEGHTFDSLVEALDPISIFITRKI